MDTQQVGHFQKMGKRKEVKTCTKTCKKSGEYFGIAGLSGIKPSRVFNVVFHTLITASKEYSEISERGKFWKGSTTRMSTSEGEGGGKGLDPVIGSSPQLIHHCCELTALLNRNGKSEVLMAYICMYRVPINPSRHMFDTQNLKKFQKDTQISIFFTPDNLV